VCRRAPGGKGLVVGCNRAFLHVHGRGQYPRHLEPVAEDHFQVVLEAREQQVYVGLRAGELDAREFGEGGGVAVGGKPAVGDLAEPLSGPCALCLAVLRHQLAFQGGHWQLRRGGRGTTRPNEQGQTENYAGMPDHDGYSNASAEALLLPRAWRSIHPWNRPP
jgi:hypothetical protein